MPAILKYFSMAPDGQYKLSFRAEYFNLFNRHYYDINGCGGRKATIGQNNFGQIFGVNSDPANRAVCCSAHVLDGG